MNLKPVVSYLPVFENKEKIVLVMEYASGGELYDYLSFKKVLTEAEARRVFRQVASAVLYCHKVYLMILSVIPYYSCISFLSSCSL